MPDVEVTCPRCGSRTMLMLPLQRSADEFCLSCDYPLFWAVDPVATGDVEASSAPAPSPPLLPDVGRLDDPECRRCAHHNPDGAVYCNQCGEPLDAGNC